MALWVHSGTVLHRGAAHNQVIKTSVWLRCTSKARRYTSARSTANINQQYIGHKSFFLDSPSKQPVNVGTVVLKRSTRVPCKIYTDNAYYDISGEPIWLLVLVHCAAVEAVRPTVCAEKNLAPILANKLRDSMGRTTIPGRLCHGFTLVYCIIQSGQFTQSSRGLGPRLGSRSDADQHLLRNWMWPGLRLGSQTWYVSLH